MKNKKIIAFVSIVAIFSACTIKLDNYVQKNSETFLSIEGGISDQAEQQSIRLSRTLSKTDFSALYSPIKSAKVYVTDEKGERFDFLATDEAGLYKTTEKKGGHAGGTYTLHMEIDGQMYESTAEILPICPEIDKLYYESNIQEKYPLGDPRRIGFDVYINFKDPLEKGNYYRWNWRHYDSIDICGRCSAGWDDAINLCTAAPGLNADKPLWRVLCRSQCYDIKYNPNINILTDDNINGQQVSRLFITRVPYMIDPNYTSGELYYLRVEQKAVSKRTFQLYEQLKNSDTNGTLFDVPALTPTNLNITCLSDPSQKVIGIFEVYGIRYKIINVDLGVKIPNTERLTQNLIPTIDCPLVGTANSSRCSAPCLESLFRTKITPEGWGVR